MQISTRTEDFIVDTLKLKVHIGPHLREIFKDPAKKKVDFILASTWKKDHDRASDLFDHI